VYLHLRYSSKFHLPRDEKLDGTVDCFICHASSKKLLHDGKLYVSPRFACFEAGETTQLVIPLKECLTTQLVIPLKEMPGIKVTTDEGFTFLFGFALKEVRDFVLVKLTHFSRSARVRNVKITFFPPTISVFTVCRRPNSPGRREQRWSALEKNFPIRSGFKTSL
jgi:hypothetical protein